jgi:sugar lactone lactonase YvrE
MRRALSLATLIAGGLQLASCATAPGPEIGDRPFFPPPPEAPRLQYLTHFTSSREIAPERGRFASLVLGEAEAEDAVVKPYGLALHDGVLYVCDTQRNLVNLFDLRERRFGYLGFEGPGRLRKPINVRVDDAGTKYVADADRREIVVFGPDDAYRGAFGGEDLERPVDLAISADEIYVCDAGTAEIVVFERETHGLRRRFGGAGTEPGRFARPTNVTVDAAGDLYVSDTLNGRVQKLDPEGNPLRSYGELGTGFGQFARPKGVAVDPAGRLYVADAAFENVQIFDPEGRLLLFFGGAGTDAGRLNLPAQVVVDTEHVPLFTRYANPGFHLEYLVLVTSQYGPRKVNVFGFGTPEGTP